MCVCGPPSPSQDHEALKLLLYEAVESLRHSGTYKRKYALEKESAHCKGASGVVVFAHNTYSQERVALKFFWSREELDSETQWCQKAVSKNVVKIVDVVFPDPEATNTSILWWAPHHLGLYDIVMSLEFKLAVYLYGSPTSLDS